MCDVYAVRALAFKQSCVAANLKAQAQPFSGWDEYWASPENKGYFSTHDLKPFISLEGHSFYFYLFVGNISLVFKARNAM